MTEKLENRIRNCLSVLKTIDENANATSLVIAKNTGLSGSTISRTLAILKSHNLLLQTKSANGELGRNPDSYQINPNYGYYLYCSLSAKLLQIYLLNFNGEIKTSRRVTVQPDLTPGLLSEHLKDFIEQLLRETLIEREQLIALTISLPGIVEKDRETVHRIPNLPKFENVNLAGLIQKTVSLPCFISNGAQLSALGAQMLYAPEAESFAYIDITYDCGIGGGLVLNRSLYTGSGNNAGEIGDMIVDISSSGSDNMNCTLENTSGIHAIYRQVQASLNNGRAAGLRQLMSQKNTAAFDLELLEKAAGELDLDILEILNRATKSWAAAIINVVSMFAPDTVMVGGAISDRSVLIRKMLMKHLRDLYYKPIDLRFDREDSEVNAAGATRIFKQYLYGVALSQRL